MRRRDIESFSPKILQAGAVKGLIRYSCTVLYSVLYDCLQYLDILQAGAVKGLIQYCSTVLYSVLYDCLQYPEILQFGAMKGNEVLLYSAVFCTV